MLYSFYELAIMGVNAFLQNDFFDKAQIVNLINEFFLANNGSLDTRDNIRLMYSQYTEHKHLIHTMARSTIHVLID